MSLRELSRGTSCPWFCLRVCFPGNLSQERKKRHADITGFGFFRGMLNNLLQLSVGKLIYGRNVEVGRRQEVFFKPGLQNTTLLYRQLGEGYSTVWGLQKNNLKTEWMVEKNGETSSSGKQICSWVWHLKTRYKEINYPLTPDGRNL